MQVGISAGLCYFLATEHQRAFAGGKL